MNVFPNNRVIISSALPLSKSGYGNQTLYMVDGFIRNNIEIPALICWNVNSTNIIKDVNKPHKLKDILNIFFPDMNGNAILKIHDYIHDVDDKYIETFGNINIYPVLSENWTEGNYKINSTKLFNHICVKEQCKIIIFHQDMFSFQHISNNESFMAHSILFAPLHFYPLDKPNKLAMKHFEILVGLCDFGMNLMKENFPEKQINKIPLCVDLNTYNIGKNDKIYYKQKLGFNKQNFVCAIVSNNKEYVDRKAFLQNLKAFAMFQSKYNNARLYLHTRTTEVLNLMSLLKKERVKFKYIKTCNQIKYDSHGYSSNDVANILRGSDVLLSASKSEGFGIPIIEAQACGCPVITTNFSSMPELTVNGICTEYSKIEKYPDDNNVYWAIPDEKNIYAALDTIYNWTLDVKEQNKEKGILFAQTFSKDILAKKIIELINNL